MSDETNLYYQVSPKVWGVSGFRLVAIDCEHNVRVAARREGSDFRVIVRATAFEPRHLQAFKAMGMDRVNDAMYRIRLSLPNDTYAPAQQYLGALLVAMNHDWASPVPNLLELMG